MMTKSPRFIAALSFFFLATTAVAGDVEIAGQRLREGDLADAPLERKAAPLLYALPPLDPHEEQVLEIRVLQKKHLLVREVVALPAGFDTKATVDVLYTHPDQLIRLRDIEKETPGSLRFLATIGERVLTDEPFAKIEAAGKKLRLESAIGQIREVQVKPAPKLSMAAEGYYYDPDCISWCDLQFNSCMEWCDPRGSDCNLCYTWYHDCSVPCPLICADPKSVTTYNSLTFVSSTPQLSSCRALFHPSQFGTVFNLTYSIYQVNTYQRTTNCDNSYTDVWIGSSQTSTQCWQSTPFTCGPSQGGYPYPSCP